MEVKVRPNGIKSITAGENLPALDVFDELQRIRIDTWPWMATGQITITPAEAEDLAAALMQAAEMARETTPNHVRTMLEKP